MGLCLNSTIRVSRADVVDGHRAAMLVWMFGCNANRGPQFPPVLHRLWAVAHIPPLICNPYREAQRPKSLMGASQNQGYLAWSVPTVRK